MMENKIIYAVIVIYNKNYKESITYNCIKDNGNIRLIVCDNSTKDCGNAELQGCENVTYINMGGNMGLSKAYNRAVESIEQKVGYLCLLDDDTQIPDGFFSGMLDKAQKSDADIVLPVVFDARGYMSPAKINGAKVDAIKSLDELDASNITGINSGMFIKLEIFENYRYDEKYFLDYIDHAFIMDMKKAGKKIEVAEQVELNQNFSANDFFHFESTKKRFKIFYKDFWKFCCACGGTKAKLIAVATILRRWSYMYFVIRNYPFYAKHIRTPIHKYIKKDGKFY